MAKLRLLFSATSGLTASASVPNLVLWKMLRYKPACVKFHGNGIALSCNGDGRACGRLLAPEYSVLRSWGKGLVVGESMDDGVFTVRTT